MQFKYYVLNYDCNAKKIVPFNIFRNIHVQEWTEKAVRKYLRSPKNFTYKSFDDKEILHGFDAFVKELDGIVAWQEHWRCEYEISVGDAFETNINNYEKWDTYSQAKPNMVIIAHEVIRQYNEQLKREKARNPISFS